MKIFSTICIFSVVFSAFAAEETAKVNNQKTTVLTIGTGDGLNAIPFGGLPGQDRYQQFYYSWNWERGTTQITGVGFSSNPIGGAGTTNLNVTIRLGVSEYNFPTYNFDWNLGKGQVVYNGPITAVLNGQPGDLHFPFMHPFLYDAKGGKPLVVDIEIYSVSGFTGSYRFGASPNTGRVYKNLNGGVTVDPAAGLQTRFDVLDSGGK